MKYSIAAAAIALAFAATPVLADDNAIATTGSDDFAKRTQTTAQTTAVPLTNDESQSIRAGMPPPGFITIMVDGREITTIDVGVIPVGFDPDTNSYVSPGAGTVTFVMPSTTPG